MKTYPIMLNLEGRQAVVVGGGTVGMRKAKALAAAGAEVTLVTGHEPSAIVEEVKGVVVFPNSYAPELLSSAHVVMACTDDPETNSRVASDARRAGALVNVADQPSDCDFILPAVYREGPITIAVGTNGMSPSLAGRLRDILAESLPEEVGQFTELIGRIRQRIQDQISDAHVRGNLMKRLATKETHDLFRTGGDVPVLELAEKLIAATKSR